MRLNDFSVQMKTKSVFWQNGRNNYPGLEELKQYPLLSLFLVEFYKTRNKKIKVRVKGFVDTQECHTEVSYINRG